MNETVLVVYATMSLVTALFYGLDKRAARLDRSRTPESTLHLLELLGGWPGALIAQQLFRHKRRKKPFLLVTWLIVAMHIAGWTYFATRP